MSFVNYKGAIIATENAAVHFMNTDVFSNNGIFETLLIKNNTINLANLHWARLTQGIQSLHLQLPNWFTQDYFNETILELAVLNKMEKLCRARIQFIAPHQSNNDDIKTVEYLIETAALDKAMVMFNEQGLVCGIANNIFKSNNPEANLKSNKRLVFQQAAQKAQQENWDDALIVNKDGNIIESSIANVFWVKEGKIFTPPLSEGCVAGVMRQHIISSCSHDFEIEEKPFTYEALCEADEVFLTNAIRGIKWIRQVAQNHYTNITTKKLVAFIKAI